MPIQMASDSKVWYNKKHAHCTRAAPGNLGHMDGWNFTILGYWTARDLDFRFRLSASVGLWIHCITTVLVADIY